MNKYTLLYFVVLATSRFVIVICSNAYRGVQDADAIQLTLLVFFQPSSYEYLLSMCLDTWIVVTFLLSDSGLRGVGAYHDQGLQHINKRVTWQVARSLCSSYGKHLAEIDSSAKAKAVADALAETWDVAENIWIGGHKHEGVWRWLSENNNFETSIKKQEGMDFDFPPWMDKTPPQHEKKNCLAMDRIDHDIPVFIDLSCDAKRSFICELDPSAYEAVLPILTRTIKSGGKEYSLYFAKSNFEDAVAYCINIGQQLAELYEYETALELMGAMIKSRPALENFWIGIRYDGAEWRWLSGPIVENTTKTKDGKLKSLQFYPVFAYDQRRHGKDCVVMDRHLSDDPEFIDLPCDRKGNFACMVEEKGPYTKEPERVITTFITGNMRYVIVEDELSWYAAKTNCQNMPLLFNESPTLQYRLATFYTIDQLKILSEKMAEGIKEIDHIWLGGRINEQMEWEWDSVPGNPTITETMVVSDEPLSTKWCNDDVIVDMGCLNMDRELYSNLMFYGMECPSPQPSICEIPLVHDSTEIFFDPELNIAASTLVQDPMNFEDAHQFCAKERGSLWVPVLEHGKLSLYINPSEYSGLLFVDVKQIDREFFTNNGKDRFMELEQEFVNEPQENDCLIADSSSNETVEWTFVSCYEKINATPICHTKCNNDVISLRQYVNDDGTFNKELRPVESNYTRWSCTYVESDYFNERKISQQCSAVCGRNAALHGPAAYKCDTRGWLHQGKLTPSASYCVELADSLDFLIRDFPKKSPNRIVFALSSGNLEDYKSFTKLMVKLLEIYSSNGAPEQFKVMVILMPAAVKVTYQFKGDVCGSVAELMRLIKRIEKQAFAKSYLEHKWFDMVYDLSKYSGNTFLYILTTSGVGKQISPNKVNIIKKFTSSDNNTAYAVGSSSYSQLEQLEDLVIVSNDTINSVVFNREADLYYTVDRLECSATPCKCNIDNTTPPVVNSDDTKKEENDNEEDEDDRIVERVVFGDDD